MALKIYNSLSRKKETFKPITEGYVGMYVCGPTVSGESHLGHARPYITFDIVYRYLTFLGYKVRYVRNITDAGHFEEEGREAEDKISKKAILEKIEPMELVQKYTNLYHWAMKEFNNVEREDLIEILLHMSKIELTDLQWEPLIQTQNSEEEVVGGYSSLISLGYGTFSM